MPKVLNHAIAIGCTARAPRAEWVALKGLSAISDILPPQVFAEPGFARVYNKQIAKIRRRVAFSAFVSGISKSELEARLETDALTRCSGKGASNAAVQ